MAPGKDNGFVPRPWVAITATGAVVGLAIEDQLKSGSVDTPLLSAVLVLIGFWAGQGIDRKRQRPGARPNGDDPMDNVQTTLDVGFKRCYRCRQEKPPADFYRDRSRRDGLSSACRPCALEVAAENRVKVIGRNPATVILVSVAVVFDGFLLWGWPW